MTIQSPADALSTASCIVGWSPGTLYLSAETGSAERRTDIASTIDSATSNSGNLADMDRISIPMYNPFDARARYGPDVLILGIHR